MSHIRLSVEVVREALDRSRDLEEFASSRWEDLLRLCSLAKVYGDSFVYIDVEDAKFLEPYL